MAAASAAVLGTALGSQFIGGLRPCELCHWQRYPYVATILLGIAGAVLARRAPRGNAAPALAALAGLVFLAGAGIAFFHVGVEYKWWEGTNACGAGGGTIQSIDDLRRMLESAPIVRCDEPAWSMAGISMAGYNMLVSLALAAIALLGARRTWSSRSS
ncbi:MAG: disulfide bond formation protein B [Alphaproteobacteria bacterium]|nr:disulfide bond formation protein B [Alphaproteobacteria bacterium]